MPGLAELTLHEACDRPTLAALAAWPGINQIESLIRVGLSRGPANQGTGWKRLTGNDFGR
jgi:hypothetical protein